MRALLLALTLFSAQLPERVADIQVHGNTLTPDARIIEIAGVQVGSPVTPTTAADIERRLRDAHAFEKVEVLKRYASIEDPSQIALVIVVDEGRVEVFGDIGNLPAGVRKRRGPSLMVMPLLSKDDGYGVTYGAQFAAPEPMGSKSRVSFPLTWGGEKRAAVEAEVPLNGGPLTRLKASAAISRREHPFFKENDDRRGATARVERDVTRRLRFGTTATVERIAFLGEHDTHGEFGVDALVDTRIDPFLPGNAVYGRAAWSRLQFGEAPSVARVDLDARGYVGLPHAGVIVLRGVQQRASAPLPTVLKPMLGGSETLRGFHAASWLGDNVAAASAEIRMPLNSVLSRAKLGASVFMDVGAAYDDGARVHDQKFQRGVGGGFWLMATVFRANLYLAHGLGGDTRMHFTLSTSF